MARGIGNGRGKPVTTKTRLGRMITERGLKVYLVCGQTQIHNRLMTEYIQARRVILPEHVEALCRVLDCDPEDIVEPNLKENLTDVTGMPLSGSRTVRDLDMSHLEPEPIKRPEPPRPTHRPIVAPDRIMRAG